MIWQIWDRASKNIFTSVSKTPAAKGSSGQETKGKKKLDNSKITECSLLEARVGGRRGCWEKSNLRGGGRQEKCTQKGCRKI